MVLKLEPGLVHRIVAVEEHRIAEVAVVAGNPAFHTVQRLVEIGFVVDQDLEARTDWCFDLAVCSWAHVDLRRLA